VGLCVLVVCVLRAPVVLLEAHAQKCIKNLANHGILEIAGKLVMRRAKLLHLIRVSQKMKSVVCSSVDLSIFCFGGKNRQI
jgi:hypothetical protein